MDLVLRLLCISPNLPFALRVCDIPQSVRWTIDAECGRICFVGIFFASFSLAKLSPFNSLPSSRMIFRGPALSGLLYCPPSKPWQTHKRCREYIIDKKHNNHPMHFNNVACRIFPTAKMRITRICWIFTAIAHRIHTHSRQTKRRTFFLRVVLFSDVFLVFFAVCFALHLYPSRCDSLAILPVKSFDLFGYLLSSRVDILSRFSMCSSSSDLINPENSVYWSCAFLLYQLASLRADFICAADCWHVFMTFIGSICA